MSIIFAPFFFSFFSITARHKAKSLLLEAACNSVVVGQYLCTFIVDHYQMRALISRTAVFFEPIEKDGA